MSLYQPSVSCAKKTKSLTVLVAPELLDKLDSFMLARDEIKAQVVERALRYFFRFKLNVIQ